MAFLSTRPCSFVSSYRVWSTPFNDIVPRLVCMMEDGNKREEPREEVPTWYRDLLAPVKDRDLAHEPGSPTAKPDQKPSCRKVFVCICGPIGDSAHAIKIRFYRVVRTGTRFW